MKLIHTTFVFFLAEASGTNIDSFHKQTDTAKSHLRGGSERAKEGYSYDVDGDCYSESVTCPETHWCQVDARSNWYPWDVSYMNRGRCLPYAPLGSSCEVPFEGITSFPRKEDGHFFERAHLCAPETTCTGEHVFVMPSTCVVARDPRQGCMTTERNGFAGRPKDEIEKAPNDDSFCFFPPLDEEMDATNLAEDRMSDESHESSTYPPGITRMTKEKLEQCATILTSFNGPNFSFAGEGGALPDDAHIQSGKSKSMTKKALYHGSKMAPNVQKILQTLWPYPICDDSEEGDSCTRFPIPVPARDDDGGLNPGKCLVPPYRFEDDEVLCEDTDPSVDMNFLLPDSGNGVIDYLCTWAVLHTLTFNGPPVLTAAEKLALGELLIYISGQFDCKVCRNNFVHIIEYFGLPKGNIREDYARWLWQAHNNANEHTYATHSKAGERTPEWANPTYEHPWYMTFEDAVSVWVNTNEFGDSQYR